MLCVAVLQPVVCYVMCSSVATSGMLCYVYQCGMLCVLVWYVMCSSVATSGMLCVPVLQPGWVYTHIQHIQVKQVTFLQVKNTL